MSKIFKIDGLITKNNNIANRETKKSEKVSFATLSKQGLLIQSLSPMARLNDISFEGRTREPEIGLTEEELQIRTNKKHLLVKKMLSANSPEYQNLEEGDKLALKHLVKAAKAIEEVYLKQDNKKNIPFRTFLEEKVVQGDESAEKTLRLFNAQKGIIAKDMDGKEVVLKKGEKKPTGGGYFPSNLTPKGFHKIINRMLDEGKGAEVHELLSQYSVVKWDGADLKAVDYTDEYKKEFTEVAEELEKAAETSTNEDFNEFLCLQAAALRDKNPMLDALADKKWATLQYTPLEFTITRENYDDMMTGTIFKNKELSEKLKRFGITPIKKDQLGARVGIVNKEGTEELLDIKKYLPLMAQNMPFNDEYEQSISTNLKADSKQTMVDADIVLLAGEVGFYRGSIVIAENLPNNDKRSLAIGGGKRNVYHRQVRMSADPQATQEKLDAILEPTLQKYYSDKADHWFTIAHENVHSLGPKIKNPNLGLYTSIIEENKADMGALAMLDVLVAVGKYTEEEKKKIITSAIVKGFKKAQPSIDGSAHRIREVMQIKHFLDERAITIDKDGIIDIDFDKVVPASRKMLEKIVKVQMKDDFKTAEKYVLDNFVWTEAQERVAKNLRKVDKAINGELENTLADKLLEEE